MQTEECQKKNKTFHHRQNDAKRKQCSICEATKPLSEVDPPSSVGPFSIWLALREAEFIGRPLSRISVTRVVLMVCASLSCG